KEYVYGRMKLSDLIPQIQARFIENEITAGHAILIARLLEESQVVAAKELFDTENFEDPATGNRQRVKVAISVRDLQNFISQNIQMDLAKAPFSTSDPDLFRQAGACIACPKRSGAEPQLWPEIGKRDLCGDRTCYHKKLNAYIADEVRAGQLVRLTDNWSDRQKKDHYYVHDFAKVSGKKCDDTVTGIFVEGWERGKTQQICTNKACEVHYRDGHASGGYERPQRPPGEQLESAKQSINTNMDALYRSKVYEAALEKITLASVDLVKLCKKPAMVHLLKVVYERADSSTTRKLTEELKLPKAQYSQSAQASAVAKYADKFDTGKLIAFMLQIALKNLSLGFELGWARDSKGAAGELTEIAEAFGVKADAIKKEVDEERKQKIAKAKARIDSAKKNSKNKKLQTSAKAKPADDEDDIDDIEEG